MTVSDEYWYSVLQEIILEMIRDLRASPPVRIKPVFGAKSTPPV
jgi:hypothetical protein